MSFLDTAQYYDLLYKDKDYHKEADYLNGLIKEFSTIEPETLLDIGCGTGKHDKLFVEMGYAVTGIDLSEKMIAIAKEKEGAGLNFSVQNANSFDLNIQYDVVLSLFDAMCYQTSDTDLNNTFKNISGHLVKNGLLIFDFWYGPAVLKDKPVKRTKELENENVRIHRLASPNMLTAENIVEVNYELNIEDKATKKQEKVKEQHRVRYFFKEALAKILNTYGLELIHEEEFLTKNELSDNTWKACWVVRKK